MAPAGTLALLAGAIRWLIAALLLAGTIRAVLLMLRRRSADNKGELDGQLDSSRGV